MNIAKNDDIIAIADGVVAQLRKALHSRKYYEGYDYATSETLTCTGREWALRAARYQNWIDTPPPNRFKKDSDGTVTLYCDRIRLLEVYAREADPTPTEKETTMDETNPTTNAETTAQETTVTTETTKAKKARKGSKAKTKKAKAPKKAAAPRTKAKAGKKTAAPKRAKATEGAALIGPFRADSIRGKAYAYWNAKVKKAGGLGNLPRGFRKGLIDEMNVKFKTNSMYTYYQDFTNVGLLP